MLILYKRPTLIPASFQCRTAQGTPDCPQGIWVRYTSIFIKSTAWLLSSESPFFWGRTTMRALISFTNQKQMGRARADMGHASRPGTSRTGSKMKSNAGHINVNCSSILPQCGTCDDGKGSRASRAFKQTILLRTSARSYYSLPTKGN